MTYDLQKKHKEIVVPEMMKLLKLKTPLAVPKIEKVVINIGTGSVKDEDRKKGIEKYLAVLTGQKPIERLAKKSIASFKVRKGYSNIGLSVTLRGKRMYDFLNRFVFAGLPRGRDFRGLDKKAIDAAGNFSVGLKDGLIFPEMTGEDTRNSFGLSISVVTTAKNKEIAFEFLKLIGFPFKKEAK